MFDQIDRKFHLAGKPVIFAWGDRIYNPARIDIPGQLLAHEAVHGQRQGNDVRGWWKRYIKDAEFRLAEEIPAHVAEYQWLVLHAAKNGQLHMRQRKRWLLRQTADRLANPIYGYGGMCTRTHALAQLKARIMVMKPATQSSLKS